LLRLARKAPRIACLAVFYPANRVEPKLRRNRAIGFWNRLTYSFFGVFRVLYSKFRGTGRSRMEIRGEGI
jgi:hypothetical protein